MTLNFSATIELTAKEKTKAIFDSIATDNKFYPQNPTNTKMSFNKKILVEIESKQIPQLRANLNSTLRLIQASIDSIDSVNT
jgi:KEOPS complex subunit Pcc1|tara:strand:- start:1988 stop:2233 length:246 start_codon:yes stop_codon:yes gene_type:complete